MTQDERDFLAAEIEREADFRKMMVEQSTVPHLMQKRSAELRMFATQLRNGDSLI
jgi:hypothetical protein